MTRSVALLLAGLIALATPAWAQTQCPGSSAAYAWSLPAPMQWGFYDLNPPAGVAVGMLSVLWLDGSAISFAGVPQQVAQSFRYAANPAQFYQTQIYPPYHAIILVSQNKCPLLLTQGGALWSK